jgi:hypothetical protein
MAHDPFALKIAASFLRALVNEDCQHVLPLPSSMTSWRPSTVPGATGAQVLQAPEEVEAVYGLDRYLPILQAAGLPTPRTALVPLDECSIVTAPYEVDGVVVGTVGVIGPTRMAYERVIPIVDITAKLLGNALTAQLNDS